MTELRNLHGFMQAHGGTIHAADTARRLNLVCAVDCSADPWSVFLLGTEAKGAVRAADIYGRAYQDLQADRNRLKRTQSTSKLYEQQFDAETGLVLAHAPPDEEVYEKAQEYLRLYLRDVRFASGLRYGAGLNTWPVATARARSRAKAMRKLMASPPKIEKAAMRREKLKLVETAIIQLGDPSTWNKFKFDKYVKLRIEGIEREHPLHPRIDAARNQITTSYETVYHGLQDARLLWGTSAGAMAFVAPSVATLCASTYFDSPLGSSALGHNVILGLVASPFAIIAASQIKKWWQAALVNFWQTGANGRLNPHAPTAGDVAPTAKAQADLRLQEIVKKRMPASLQHHIDPPGLKLT